jgi:RNA-dependent RNA polymerase
LDGDIYFVIWDENLIPNRAAPPLDYSPSQGPTEVPGGAVTVEHIVDSFLNYMKNDQLGRIANGHLAVADSHSDGPLASHPTCEKLVMLHSTAVDFAKTGVPVDPRAVSELLKNVEYPDYLRGPRVSETVIGHISRDAKQRSTEEAKIVEGQRSIRTATGREERWFEIEGSDEYLQWAHEMVEDWTMEFLDMMATCAPLRSSRVYTHAICDECWRQYIVRSSTMQTSTIAS